MAFYKYDKFVHQLDDPKFDEICEPGSSTRWSGIYRCEGCHQEVVSIYGKPLPPQNHHQHELSQGSIRWRLVVW
jgi:hypothetical protein